MCEVMRYARARSATDRSSAHTIFESSSLSLSFRFRTNASRYIVLNSSANETSGWSCASFAVWRETRVVALFIDIASGQGAELPCFLSSYPMDMLVPPPTRAPIEAYEPLFGHQPAQCHLTMSCHSSLLQSRLPCVLPTPNTEFDKMLNVPTFFVLARLCK